MAGLKPARANSSYDPISKKPITRKGLVEWLKMCRPWVQTPVPQNKQTNKKQKAKSVACDCVDTCFLPLLLVHPWAWPLHLVHPPFMPPAHTQLSSLNLSNNLMLLTIYPGWPLSSSSLFFFLFPILFLFHVFIYFWLYQVWTQRLRLSSQVLYHLSHDSNPFCF
jgi:hypothetical protein